MKRTIRWMGLELFLLALLAPVTFSAELSSPGLAWQSSGPIVPAAFESYFPDNPDAAARLSELPNRSHEELPAAKLIGMVREGLRRASPKIGNEWIKWIGQKLITGRRDGRQDQDAIELAYHASAHPDLQYDALYYGLSRVDDKTPAIIGRMVEIAMSSDDWGNVVGHVAWAGQDHREKMLAALAPHLASSDPAKRAQAEILRRIFSGEMTAHEHAIKVAIERATAKFGDQMPALRQRFTEGDSGTRQELLRTIQQNSLAVIMDDSWIDAYRAAALDPDRRVREEVARQFGSRWVWNLKKTETINPRALELLLQLSRDENKEVRYNTRYFGLDRLPDNPTAQARIREMEAENLTLMLTQMREYARTAIEQRRFDQVESMLHEIRPGLKDDVPAPTRERVTQFVKEIENQVAEARRPKGELQKRIDAAAAGDVIELGEGTFEGPLLIEKPLTLRGVTYDRTTISYQGDTPAITITATNGVRLERLRVRWSAPSPEAKMEDPAAIAVRDATAVLQSIALEPIDRPSETAYGVMAVGQADVQFLEGRSRGFAYALIWLKGARGRVLDSDLRGAGHSVVTIHPGSNVEVARNILADCGYHAVRVTGGAINMHDNIVMGCTRAGVYLGNNDAHGRIYNNLFTANLGEIWGYAGSDVVIENNLFYRSNDPAVIFRNTCALVARANSFTANPAALRQYIHENDPVRNGIRLEGNHYWQNKQDLQPSYEIGGNAREDDRFQLKETTFTLQGDPKFRDPASGDFTPLDGSALLRDNRNVAGLTDPQSIHHLARQHNLRFAIGAP